MDTGSYYFEPENYKSNDIIDNKPNDKIDQQRLAAVVQLPKVTKLY